MPLTFYFYWTARIFTGATDVIYVQSCLYFLPPLHSPRLQLMGLRLHHTKAGRASWKMFGYHSYVPLMNSLTLLEVMPWLYNQLSSSLGGRDGRFQSLLPLAELSISKSRSSPCSKIPSACTTWHECPSFSGAACRHPASSGGVSQALLGCRGTFWRQIRLKAPQIWAQQRCDWNILAALGKKRSHGLIRGHVKTTWPQQNLRFPNVCYKSPK